MAILAQELLAACSVFAIPDNICAMTCRTLKDYRFAYHVPFISSFRKSHHRFFIYPKKEYAWEITSIRPSDMVHMSEKLPSLRASQ